MTCTRHTRARHGIRQRLREAVAEITMELRQEADEAARALEARVTGLEAENRTLKERVREAETKSDSALELWEIVVSNGES